MLPLTLPRRIEPPRFLSDVRLCSTRCIEDPRHSIIPTPIVREESEQPSILGQNQSFEIDRSFPLAVLLYSYYATGQKVIIECEPLRHGTG